MNTTVHSGCRLYGCLGAIFGTCSIMSMVVIGYDRYNVIVKGFSGKKISPGLAAGILGVIWAYSILICSAPFAGWGDYMAEGLLLTCTYDFLSPAVNERTFVLVRLHLQLFLSHVPHWDILLLHRQGCGCS